MRRIQAIPGPYAEADAALGSVIESDCRNLAALFQPHVERLESALDARLKHNGYTLDERRSMLGITSITAICRVAGGMPVERFAEEIRYRGRRLAKLGLTPASVIRALREADFVVAPLLAESACEAQSQYRRAADGLNFVIVLALNAAYHAVREAESRAFYELFRVETDSPDLWQMLEGFRDVLLRYTGAAEARLYWIGDGGDSAGDLASEHAHIITRPLRRRVGEMRCYVPANTPQVDTEWERRFSQCWSVPLSDRHELRGLLVFGFDRPYPWLSRERELLAAAAERCGIAAEKARLSAQIARNERKLRQLAGHMVVVEESERRRISRELHDEAGQSLLCVRLKLDMIESGLPRELSRLKSQVREAREMCEHSIVEIRRLIAALSPAVLEQMGLAAALRQLVGRFRDVHPASVRIAIPRRLEGVPRRTAIIIYRLVQEIFNNIAKYSLATEVKVSVRKDDEGLKLRVADNGVGFDVEHALSRTDCHGLSGMRERVALLGGEISVVSRMQTETPHARGRQALGRGTEIEVRLPLVGQPADRTESEQPWPSAQAPEPNPAIRDELMEWTYASNADPDRR